MYNEVKHITECVSCHRTLSDAITIVYGSRYLCPRCYKKVQGYDSELKQWASAEAQESEKEFENLFKQINVGRFFCERYEFEEKKTALTPKEVVAYLDRNVVGQNEAKKALAVAVCNHQRRISAGKREVTIPKSNVLMQGSTGSGKTYILKMLAELLDVPLFIADASLITEASYKGNDVESVVTGLYQAASCNVEKTEKGIIYLDEFDKLSAKFGCVSGESSVGAGVQRQMLKMIEGCVMDIPKSGYKKSGDSVSINTENILFICGGAFVGIKKDKKPKKERAIGFGAELHDEEKCIDVKKKLCPADFINYGLIPEMVGRLPIIVSLDDLTEKDMVDILTNTENSLIKKYKALFKESYDVELDFGKGVLEEIAHQAYIRKTGARGINAIVEGVMQELLFEVPSDPTIRKCVITKDVVCGNAIPYIIRDNDASISQAS